MDHFGLGGRMPTGRWVRGITFRGQTLSLFYPTQIGPRYRLVCRVPLALSATEPCGLGACFLEALRPSPFQAKSDPIPIGALFILWVVRDSTLSRMTELFG